MIDDRGSGSARSSISVDPRSSIHPIFDPPDLRSSIFDPADPRFSILYSRSTRSSIFDIRSSIYVSRSLLKYERMLWGSGYRHVAGVDEAGRGCLAGPVVAAAVVFPPEVRIRGVKDSKMLTLEEREKLRTKIERKALAIGVGMASPEEIDRLNILWASMRAMRRAVSDLDLRPQHLLIDGNRCFPDSPWPFWTVVAGDAKCHAIAAASIIAKTTRDRLMQEKHEEHPAYHWITNVGYPTPEHYRALRHLGPTPLHRRTFRGVLGGV